MKHLRSGLAGLLFVLLILLAAVPALAQGGGVLTFGEPITATLEEGDQHVYTFRSEGGEMISAAMNAEDDALDPLLELYAPNGDLIAFNDDWLAGRPNAALTDIHLEAAGVYTLVARSFGNASGGDYELLATRRASDLVSGGGSIGYDQTVSGELLTEGQQDRWTFAGEAGDVISVAMDVASASSNLDPLVELYSPGGDLLIYSDDDGGHPNSLISGYTLPADGDYTLVARSWGDRFTGPYTLTLSAGVVQPPITPTPTFPPDFPPQGGPTVGHEGEIALGETVSGELSAGTMDLWTFEAAAPNLAVSIELHAVDDAYDTYLYLTDANGLVLTQDDDSGGGLNSAILRYALPGAGTYIIQARSFGDDDSGAYTLSLDEAQPPQANSGSIAVGETISATLDTGARDEWTFEAEGGTQYTIALYADGNAFDTYLYLRDENGFELFGDDDGGPGLNSQIIGWEAPADGSYVIQVSSFSGSAGGAYSLILVEGDRFLWPETWRRGAIPFGEEIVGTLAEGQLNQVWTFEVAANSWLSITFSGDGYIELLDAGGNYVNDYYGGDLPFQLRQSGQYYLVVNGYTPGDYTLLIERVEAPEANEGNIEPGQTVSAELFPATEDLWTFVAREGEVFSAALYSDNNIFDPVLRLTDEDGNELVYADGGGLRSNSLLRGWEAPADGAYVLRVSGLSSGGPYHLMLAAGDRFLLPEGIGQGAIPLGVESEGEFTQDNFYHVWTFESAADGYFVLELGSLNGYVEVLDSDGIWVISPASGVPFNLTRAGQYFLAINGYEPGTYSITLNEAEPPQVNEGEIAPGETVEAVLAPGAEDRWTFEAEAGQSYTIALFASGSPTFDTILRLVDESGAELSYDDDGGPGLNSQLRGWVAPEDGAYTIRVSSFSGSAGGDYTLMLAEGEAALWPEAWLQGSLPFDEGTIGELTGDALIHIWTFEAGAGQWFEITYSGDGYIELTDSDGLYVNFPGAGVPFAIESAGLYVLTINGYTPGQYTLTLTPIEPPEINTGSIAVGGEASAELFPGTQDEWTFAGETGDVITAAVYAENGSFDTVLRLTDSLGAEIAYDDDGALGLNSQIRGFRLPAAGDYTLYVGTFGSAGRGGPYTLYLRAGDQMIIPDSWLQGEIALGEPVSGSSETDVFYHVWSFEAAAGQYFRLDYSDFNYYLEIMDADGNYVTAPGTNTPFQLALGGQYYISINGYVAGAYTFTLSESEPPQINSGNIEPGQTIEAELTPGTQDEWTFVGQQGQRVTIHLTAADYAFDTTLTLVNPESGAELFFDDDGGGNLSSLIAGYELPYSGAYLIVVNSFGGSSGGPYTLTLEVEGGAALPPSLPPSLPPVTTETTFTLGQTVFGVLDAGAADWTFDGQAGDVVALTVLAQDNGFDPTLTLFDPQGNVIAFNDDGLLGLNSLISGVVLPIPGGYTVRIQTFSGEEGGPYMLFSRIMGQVEVAPPTVEPPAVEPTVSPDALPEVMGTITPGTPVEGDLAEGAEDLWALDGTAGQVITAAVTADFDTILEIRDASGLIIVSDDDSGQGLNSLIAGFELPASGPYYVVVRSFGNRYGGPYTLTVAADGEAAATPPPAEGFPGQPVEGALPLNVPVNGQLPQGQSAYWTLDGAAGQVLRISLEAEFDSLLYVYNAAGEQLAFDDDSGDGTNSLLGRLELPAAGPYYIRVRALADRAGGAYTLGAFEPLGESTAPGGEGIIPAAEAQGELVFGESAGADLPVGGAHLWTFAGEAGQRITLRILADFDTVLHLEDAEGREIAADDDSGGNLLSLIEDFELPAGGIYTVRVRSFGDVSGGPYVLGLALATEEAGASEAAPGLNIVGVVELDTPVQGSLAAALNNAWTFEGEAGQRLDIDVEAEFDSVLEVYDADGNVIAYDDDGGEGTNSRIERLRLPADGPYQIVVSSFGSFTIGAYTLTVTESPGETASARPGAFPPRVGGNRPFVAAKTAPPPSGAVPFQAGAGTIRLGQTVSGTLTAGATVAWAYQGRAGEVIGVLVSGDFDTVLRVNDPAGNEIAFNDDSEGGLTSFIPGVALPQDGLYTIVIGSYGDAGSGAYTLTVTNGLLEGAEAHSGTLAFGQEVASTLAPGTEDAWTFTARAGQVISIAVTAAESAFDTTLSLRDAADRELIFDDDGGSETNSLIRGYEIAEDGQYTVYVSSYGGRGGGDYTLILQEGGYLLLDEANQRGPVALGQTVEGVLDPRQWDVWTFDGQAGQVISVGLWATPGSDLDTVLELVGPNGAQVAMNDDSGRDYNSMLLGVVLPDTGAYALVAHSYAEFGQGGEYSLSLLEGSALPLRPGTYKGVLEVGGAVEGLLQAEQEHAYTFASAGAADFMLELAAPDAGQVFLLELFGPDGYPVATGGALTPLVLRRPAPGQYTVIVYTLSRGGYTLRLSPAPPAGDGYNEAIGGEIVLDETLSGAVIAGQRMVYLLAAQAGERITLAAYGVDGFDPALLVFAPDGALLARDDDSGRRRDALLADLLLPQAGTYRVAVQAAALDTAGDYKLLSIAGGGLPEPKGKVETLPFGLERTAALVAPDGEAWWFFDSAAGSYVDLTLTPGEALGPLALLELRAPDGHLIARGGGRLERLYLPQDGTYRVIIYTLGTTAGGYRLLLEYSPSRLPANLTRQGEISIGSSTAHVLGRGQQDAFTFAGQAGQVIGLYAVAGEEGNPDTLLTLYDPNGQIIAFNDDLGGLNAGIEGAWLPLDGTYTAVVGSYQNGGSGAYTLTLEQQGGAPAVLGALLPGGAAQGELNSAGTRQAYTLTLDAPAQVTITALTASDTFVPLVEVFAPEGRYLRGGTGALEALALDTAGTYTVVVRSAQGAGAYTLMVTVE